MSFCRNFWLPATVFYAYLLHIYALIYLSFQGFFCTSQECFICWDNWIKNRTILSNVPNGCGEEKVEPTTKCQAKKCLKVILVRCGQTARGQHVNVAPHLLSSPIVQTYWGPLKGKHWEGICSKMICPTKNSWKIPGPVRWKSRQSLSHQNFWDIPSSKLTT